MWEEIIKCKLRSYHRKLVTGGHLCVSRWVFSNSRGEETDFPVSSLSSRPRRADCDKSGGEQRLVLGLVHRHGKIGADWEFLKIGGICEIISGQWGSVQDARIRLLSLNILRQNKESSPSKILSNRPNTSNLISIPQIFYYKINTHTHTQ